MTNNKVKQVLSDLNISQVVDITKDKEFVFFDMDGTILNSEVVHFQVIQQLCENQCKHTLAQLSGQPDCDVYPLIKNELRTDFETFLSNKNRLLVDSIPNIPKHEYMLPNMRELLLTLKENKKVALVTASEEVVTKAILKHCDLLHLFDVIITANSVKQTKPSPDPYQLALKMLKTTKEKAIVFEDSLTGIEAAKRADIDTIKVTWYEG